MKESNVHMKYSLVKQCKALKQFKLSLFLTERRTELQKVGPLCNRL